MSYTENRDGYAIETTLADGTTIDAAGDTALLLGKLATRNIWPTPEWEIIHSMVGVNAKEVADGLFYKTQPTRDGQLTLMMQNGIPCWLAMGADSTVDADPIFTHTITPTTDGSQLPSMVWQHEEKGSGTNEEFQFQGVKVDSLLMSQEGTNPLMAKLEIKGTKEIDPGFALTNSPALPTGGNADPYMSLTRTWDVDGTPVSIDGLVKIEIAISNGLTPVFADSYDGGTYTGNNPWMFTEAPMKGYQINLTLHPDTIERKMFDELIGTTITKKATFKWTRSTNDYILVTATDCAVKKGEKITEYGTLKLEDHMLVPRKISIEVKDGIAGSYYT
ncbi:MAG: hypothetical protein ACYTBJ_06165 [Planctomycetota bacterium]|jgi:hypothetical protein